MKLRERILLAPLICLMLLSSCFYDVESELYLIDCATNNVSFNSGIVPILNRHCVTCHHNNSVLGGGISLQSYDQVLLYIGNGRLLASVRHEPGVSVMPPTGERIPSCDIDKLASWIDAGALNN